MPVFLIILLVILSPRLPLAASERGSGGEVGLHAFAPNRVVEVVVARVDGSGGEVGLHAFAPPRESATTVVSDCTRAGIATALAAGGTTTFDCGPGPTIIDIAQELVIDKDTVIDGGGTVTLSGGSRSRVLRSVDSVNINNVIQSVLQAPCATSRSSMGARQTRVAGYVSASGIISRSNG